MRARRREVQHSGEYTLVRKWRWAAVKARLYEAFNRHTGAPALVLKPGRVGDWAPAAKPWRAVVSSTPAQLAVELLTTERRGEALQEVTLGLQQLARAMSQVEDNPAAQSALVGDLAQARRWRARYAARPRFVAALAAAAVLALVSQPLWEGRRPPLGVRAEQGGAAQLAPGAALQPVAVAQVPRRAPGALMLDMPTKPFKGQVRAKDGKCEGRAVRAINGGCWVKLDAAAPCDDRSYEFAGGCYLPEYPPAAEPQAALRGNGQNP
jgi:hypothetical protein